MRSGGGGRGADPGRERTYLTWFYWNFAYDRSAIDEEAIDEYVRCYSAPGGLRLEYYRTFFEDAAHTRESMQQKLTIPVLALGGDACLGELPIGCMQLLADGRARRRRSRSAGTSRPRSSRPRCWSTCCPSSTA